MSGSVSGIAPTGGIAQGTGTGRYGVVTTPTMGGGTIGSGIASVFSWINEPFTRPLNPGVLFLIVGVIILSIMAWNMILFHLRLASETILE